MLTALHLLLLLLLQYDTRGVVCSEQGQVRASGGDAQSKRLATPRDSGTSLLWESPSAARVRHAAQRPPVGEDTLLKIKGIVSIFGVNLV
jgi:hypothetical protein